MQKFIMQFFVVLMVIWALACGTTTAQQEPQTNQKQAIAVERHKQATVVGRHKQATVVGRHKQTTVVGRHKQATRIITNSESQAIDVQTVGESQAIAVKRRQSTRLPMPSVLVPSICHFRVGKLSVICDTTDHCIMRDGKKFCCEEKKDDVPKCCVIETEAGKMIEPCPNMVTDQLEAPHKECLVDGEVACKEKLCPLPPISERKKNEPRPPDNDPPPPVEGECTEEKLSNLIEKERNSWMCGESGEWKSRWKRVLTVTLWPPPTCLDSEGRKSNTCCCTGKGQLVPCPELKEKKE